LIFLVVIYGAFGSIAVARANPDPDSSPLPVPKNRVNPHLVGWGNLIMPGLGETLNGNPVGGATQFGYEVGTFTLGYELSPRSGIASLDGIRDTYQPYQVNARNGQTQINSQLYSDMILEFAIKSHMTNTYIAYRDAYRAQGITAGLDQRTWWEGFATPFQTKSFEDPWVYVPLIAIAAAVALDFYTSQPDNNLSPLSPTSNFLYTSHYGLWEPLGSGWPEESFYRGFLQHEFKTATGSPLFAILAESAVFAFSHQAGSGRYSAAVVGAYLGYLAERNNGNLGPGITVHFWGDFLLGIETILISQRDQRSTPQGGLSLQFNY
jgi:membrane protease YdiL (CAAX protease family)